jgi:hypothetical protein
MNLQEEEPIIIGPGQMTVLTMDTTRDEGKKNPGAGAKNDIISMKLSLFVSS